MHNHVDQSPMTSVAELLHGCRVFHFHDTSLTAPVKRSQPTADNLALRSDAGNLAAVLATLRQGWISTYSVLKSKRLASGSYKGGAAKWSHISSELQQLLSSGFDLVTTVIDYYGLPRDAPGMTSRPRAGSMTRVEYVERLLGEAINDRRFVPHLVVHETEAWVLAAGSQLAEQLGDPALGKQCQRATEEAGGPELVNEGECTAPSKRLLAWRPTYRKAVDGPAAVVALGIEQLRERCPHTNAWLRKIERWS